MTNTPQDRMARPQQAGGTARESTAPRVVLCAVRDDDHLQDVVATGRALGRAGFEALFVHVAAPAVRLRSPLGFAGAGGSPAAGTLPLGSGVDDLGDHAREAGIELLRRAGVDEDRSIVVVGEPVAELNRLAAAHDAALVVVGSHRRGPLTTALSASVSHRLSRHGACPLLVARSGALPGAGGPVVCGIRVGDEHTTETAIRAAELALALDRHLILVYVLPGERLLPAAAGPVLTPAVLRPSRRQRRHASDVLDAVSELSERAVENVVVDGSSIAAELDSFAASRRADLLVVGCRGAGVLRRTLEGSVSLDLIRSGRQPLVVIPPAAASGALGYAGEPLTEKRS
jgi:nucleotide-binding universal stress UspA family protein